MRYLSYNVLSRSLSAFECFIKNILDPFPNGMDGLHGSNGEKEMRERGEAGCLLRLREVLRGEDRSRTVPFALEHLGEVSTGDDVLGEMVEQSIKGRYKH